MTKNGQRSDPLTIKRGVQQGSVLRPILFLLFVNDTPPQPSRSIDIFADDTIVTASAHKGKEKEKERGRKERRKSNGCTLSFYNGYFGDFWPKKTTVGGNILINPARCIF